MSAGCYSEGKRLRRSLRPSPCTAYTVHRRGRAVESRGNVPLARKRSSERIAMALRSRHVTAEEGELAMLHKRPRRLS